MKDKGLQITFIILLILLIGLILYMAFFKRYCDDLDRFETEVDKSVEELKETEKTAILERYASITERSINRERSFEEETVIETVMADMAGISETEQETVQEVIERDPWGYPVGTDHRGTFGISIPDDIYIELCARLNANNIYHFLPFAVGQLFQESRFIVTAENQSNHLDKGLCQYRITYWSAVCREHGYPEDTSIFDWKAQLAIYTADAARRLKSGLSIEETISRHKTSDYGAYDALYVSHVMRWVRIPNSCDEGGE